MPRFTGHRMRNARAAIAFILAGALVLLGSSQIPAYAGPDDPGTSTSQQSDATPDEVDEAATPDPGEPAEDDSAADEPDAGNAESDAPPVEQQDEPEQADEAEPKVPEADESEPDPAPKQDEPATIAPQAIPNPTGNDAVITVQVGGDRTGTQSVGPLPGVVLGLYDTAGAGSPVNNTWATCTTDADGDCSFVVPNTQEGIFGCTFGGGANCDRRFYVKQISVPAGWTSNPNLRTGNADGSGSQSTPYRFQTGTTLRAGNTYTSTDDFMEATGNTNRTASGGVWQQSRTNPPLSAQCGLDVALILDLSGSVQGSETALKGAADTFVNSLVGTPSRMSLFSFSTVSPASGATQNYPALASVSTAAGATTFKNRYAGWTAGGGTNWDRGLFSPAATTAQYDVAVVVTDGNPSYYNDPAEGPGNYTRLREVENGIFSANALKAKNTRVLAIGVGAGVNDSATALNLASISGKTAFDGSNGAVADYFQSPTYGAAGTVLRNLALGNCQGSVSVVKQIVPSGNTGEDVSGAVPSGAGWEFSGSTSTSGVTGLPATKTTTNDGTGTVNFPLTFAGGTTSAAVTLGESQQDGYTLVTQGGANAVCTNLNSDASVPVTNGTGTNFDVNVPSTAAVSCTVYNRAPQPGANVTVDKVWNINGTEYDEGQQPDGFQAQLSLTGPNDAEASPQGWSVTRGGYVAGEAVTVSEETDVSRPLCTLVSETLRDANGTRVNAPLPYDAVLTAGANSYEIVNEVTCESRLTLAKNVEGGDADPTLWTLDAIAPDGSLAGPTGVDGSAGVTDIPVTPEVTYQLAESGGDLNYAQVDNRTNQQSNPLSTGSMDCIEIDENGDQIPGFSDGLNGGVRVPLGSRVKCTATNQTASLALRKIVENTYGGTAAPADWQLTATPTGDFPAGLQPQTIPGSAVGASFDIRPGVDYEVTETGPMGYEMQSVVCNTGNGPQPTSTINLEPLGNGVCTFTNADTPAQLTLEKIVDANETGSGKVPADWTLTATPDGIDGQDAVSGNGDPSSAGGVDQVEVFAGGYDLAEDGPAGFDAGDWVCQGGVLDGSTVTVPSGGNVVCQITNTAVPPTLTLVKEVVNDDGGTAVPADWTLTADGPTPITGTSGEDAVTAAPVQVGTYDLTESGGPAGYTASDWDCGDATVTDGSVTIAEGDDVTCTIENDDEPALLTLVKVVDNGTTGGTAVPADWTLGADGPTPVSGAGNSPDVTGVTVDAGDYDLSESGGPTGYTASDWTCTGGTLVDSTVTAELAADVTCTITNTAQQPTLTLVKVVDNGQTGATGVPGDWTLSADGPTPVEGPGNSVAVTDQDVEVGDYDVAESDGPGGYTASAWECVGGTGFSADTVTVGLGDDVTCTVTNTAISPTLTLVKEVTNDNGGAAVPTDWTLEADGPTSLSGETGSADVSNVTVQVGSYDLAESGGTAGYAASDWECDGGTLTDSTLALDVGDDVTCTIVNDDEPAELTLVKEVDNAGTGAGAQPGDWTLTADGPTPVSGTGNSGDVTGVEVSAGDYDLSESNGPEGFTASAWECTGGDLAGSTVSVPVAGDVTCTITNTAQQPTLTLVKSVDNGETGATSGPADWTLSAEGPTELSGAGNSAAVTDQPVKVGDYELSESGPGGYDASAWTCVGTDNDDADLTIALGDNITCTITNTAISPRLTLVKKVVNDDSGTAAPTDWTLNGDGPTPISGTTGSPEVSSAPVQVGTYDLSESDGPNGYTPSAWDCDGGTLDGVQLTLAAGDDVTCTIVNDDNSGAWTVTKFSDPPSGSTVDPGDVITYTVTALKKGSGVDPTDVQVVDDLSEVLNHASLVGGSIETSTGTATLRGDELDWDIPTLSGTETVTYKVKVDADAHDVVLENAVTSPGGEPCTPEDLQESLPTDTSRVAKAAVDCDTTTHETPPQKVPPNEPTQPNVPSNPDLPDTGGTPVWLIVGGVLLVMLGGGFLLTARKRRHG